jgi:hypothetical protein
MKSNYPTYFHQIAYCLISKEFQLEFIRSAVDASKNILKYVMSAFYLLQTKNIEDLSYSFEADKNLYDYLTKDGRPSNVTQQKIYREILEDCGGDEQLAQLKSQATYVYKYYKVLKKVNLKTKTKLKDYEAIHPEKYQLNINKMKRELFTAIEPILDAYGIKDLDKLRQELISTIKEGVLF